MTEREARSEKENLGVRSNEPPVDGPGAGDDGAEQDDDAGATSYDQPGGSEHGTKE